MNKIEEFYKEAGGIEYDKFDKKADKFTYYDMIGFADAYHSKQLIIADVSNLLNDKENLTFKGWMRVKGYEKCVDEPWLKDNKICTGSEIRYMLDLYKTNI